SVTCSSVNYYSFIIFIHLTHLFTLFLFFFFNSTAPTVIYTLSLHDALPICEVQFEIRTGQHVVVSVIHRAGNVGPERRGGSHLRSEEHTSELQSLRHLVCRLLLEKKKKKKKKKNKKKTN